MYCSANKCWLWTARCRRTRQIIACVSGDHSAKTCAKLWAKIPACYKHCPTFSNFWDAYAKVFPKATHCSLGKEAGETNHMERWHCTLHQRLARFVRKTLSFSKSDTMHHVVLKGFIADDNLACISES
ncbi:MAG: IS1 family transposase [Trueperaceae bacterium]